eukprot:g210.t1
MATCFRTSLQASALSSKKTLRPGLVVSTKNNTTRSTRPVLCAAQDGTSEGVFNGGKAALAAAALAAVVSFGSVEEAKADIAGLTPCSESSAYARRQKKEVSGLTKRIAKYEEGSAPALALQATIDKTNKRFEFYAKNNLLCGTDGLPHLIADPGYAFKYGHLGEIMIPTVLFIYVAGYIGYTGRLYLEQTRSTTKEIIIDVPLALNCSLKGAGWPLSATLSLLNGTLLEKDENITVSPR